VGKLSRPSAQGEAEVSKPRAPRPKKGALKASRPTDDFRVKKGGLEAAKAIAKHEHETKRAKIHAPRPGTAAHKLWKRMGLPDREQPQLPRTKEEADYQMVSPNVRTLIELKALIEADRAWWSGQNKAKGRLDGDDSKQTRAEYARWIVKFIRRRQASLLLGPPIRKVQIRRFLYEVSTESDHLPKWPGPEPLDAIGTADAEKWLAAKKLYGAGFIKFLQLEQRWVREQIKAKPTR
jgi:hypothetical protein